MHVLTGIDIITTVRARVPERVTGGDIVDQHIDIGVGVRGCECVWDVLPHSSGIVLFIEQQDGQGHNAVQCRLRVDTSSNRPTVQNMHNIVRHVRVHELLLRYEPVQQQQMHQQLW